MRCLDGVLPTALEGLQQRREASKRLQEIDKLLRDEQDDIIAGAVAVAKTTRGCSFGSGRNPKKNARYWLNKTSSVPGPGAYAVSNADRIVKTAVGGAGALGLRSGACCRFQPCECKKPGEQADKSVEDYDGRRQDTKQPRRSSPPFVAYPRPDTEPLAFQTRELKRRVAAVQAAKQRWKHVGMSMTPNYRWTERRTGAGGALPMGKSTSRDGTGSSATKARLRKVLFADRTAKKCEVENARAAKAVETGVSINSTGRVSSSPAIDMKKFLGRDTVSCKRKHQRVVTAFGKR
ncbi:hypothetical protein F441_15361 [Phytophthora nicotianae CJ01A1]|uniref:Uncharacterized protein n=2 Tax=Phytophthora nicotianae TaxID=4792 RepID=W2G7M3_PHYNI|nr:hypothetical protein L915_15095 [Phytophthora nicotianae]ETL32449.1 hypothetical protein L916_14987 [Phytophthora nicotianae]ETP08721.1 hypothetical protein F441_15361 [Phytophthora nicotianae CJ01A1]